MPVEGGSGSGGGSTDIQTWVAIDCPPFCPVYPCPYIYLNLPAMEYYVPPDPVARSFPYSGWLLCSTGASIDDSPCNGHTWSATISTEGDPEFGQEGSRTLTVQVCCDTEKTSWPTVSFDFEDHIRNIGDPDPEIFICVRNICLSNISCRCGDQPNTGLPGYNHGVASAPKFNKASTCSDITINDQNALTSMEVRCLCNGSCDCTGIPTSLNVRLECDSGSGFETVGTGTIDFTSGTDDIDFPHWDGEVTIDSTHGNCVMRAGILCNSNPPDSYAFFLGGSPDPPTAICLDLITATAGAGVGTGSCDPFSFTLTFTGWIGCFGTARWVVEG